MEKIVELIKKKYSVTIVWHEGNLCVTIIKDGHRCQHFFTETEVFALRDLESAITATLEELEEEYEEKEKRYGD